MTILAKARQNRLAALSALSGRGAALRRPDAADAPVFRSSRTVL